MRECSRPLPAGSFRAFRSLFLVAALATLLAANGLLVDRDAPTGWIAVPAFAGMMLAPDAVGDASPANARQPVFRADWVDDVIDVIDDLLDILDEEDDEGDGGEDRDDGEEDGEGDGD